MRIGCWNIGSLFDKSKLNENDLNELCRTIQKNSIDIICFQEMLINENCIEIIKNRTRLKYDKVFYLSDSKLGKMGLAILSRYKITSADLEKIDNPNISFHNLEKDVIYKSHDKGFLIVDILYKGVVISVVCGHMLPFHSFGRDSIDFRHLYQRAYQIITAKCNNKPTIICGDFNTSKLNKILPDIYNNYVSAINSATRSNGNQNDYIFFSNDWDIKYSSIIPGELDHHFCLCEAIIKKEENQGINILHLSDIHFKHYNTTIDAKDQLLTINEDNRINQFRDTLNSLDCPDYVVITGDFTTHGDFEGFKQFNDFIFELIRKKKLPPVHKFIITPGNHDVLQSNRWDGFLKVLDGKCARPWIRENDINADEMKQELSRYFVNNPKEESFWGSIIHGPLQTKVIYPFILDVEKRILFYSFNSSIISRTKISIDEKTLNIIDGLMSKAKINEKESLRTLMALLEVDPARILPDEINLFEAIMGLLKQHYSNLNKYRKIAILHHHTTSISCTEEIKKFDSILNAGFFKCKLIENDFEIVMHGHKHWPLAFYDTAINCGGQLCTISGGSILGAVNNNNNGFFLHNISGDKVTSKYYIINSLDHSNTTRLWLNDIYEFYTIPLSTLKYEIENKLLENLNVVYYEKEDIKQVGWSKILDHSRVGSIATAYGIKILEILGCSNPFYLENRSEILETLWRFKLEGGGWNALTQYSEKGSIESTIWVIQALSISKSHYLKEGLKVFYDLLNDPDTNLNNVYTLTLVIDLLCDLDPTSDQIQVLADKLLKNAVYNSAERIKYWTQCVSSEDRKTQYKPSALHTAHAVHALYKCQKYAEFDLDLDEVLTPAKDMLMNEIHWGNVEEAMYKIIDYRKEDKLIIKHYTICWIVIALLESGVNPREKIIQEAMKRIYNSYEKGCWNYNGEYHIWAIYDALKAILIYHKYM